MKRRPLHNVIAAVAVILSLLMLHSIYRKWNTPFVRTTAPWDREQLALLQQDFAHAASEQAAARTAAAAPAALPSNPIVKSVPSTEMLVAPSVKPSPFGKPYYVFPKARQNRSVEVTFVIIVTVGTKMEAFATAINSVRCYAALHGYSIFVEFDDKFEECAVHKDKFFRRHCHTHLLMQNEIPQDTWTLFIDGDVGIVNPNRLVEEFLESGYEIYLFDRFFNWEYAALSYLVKNNERGRAWVDEFANFEFRLPQSFHGTDNGALHPFLMFYLVPETRNPATRNRMAKLCLSLWNRSTCYEDLFGMEACTRMVIGERIHFPEHRVKIYPKGSGWAHDLWIFHSHWATDDFMMHSLKEENFSPYPTNQSEQKKCRHSLLNLEANEACKLAFPVLKKLEVNKCKAAMEGWLMEGRLQIDNETRKRIYDRMANRILKKQMESVGKISEKMLFV